MDGFVDLEEAIKSESKNRLDKVEEFRDKLTEVYNG